MHLYRSHTCGALALGDVGQSVRLSGWVHRKRDHGGVLFVDLRDHYGLTQIVTDLAFYNYEAKYSAGGSQHVIPAQISPKIYQKVQTLALKAHKAMGCRGVSRSDFRYDDRFSEDGELVCRTPFPTVPLRFWGDDGSRRHPPITSDAPGRDSHK